MWELERDKMKIYTDLGPVAELWKVCVCHSVLRSLQITTSTRLPNGCLDCRRLRLVKSFHAGRFPWFMSSSLNEEPQRFM